MLVLSRKIGQEIVIGDDITVVVQGINGNRVSLGIQAPDKVRILRGELERFDAGSPKPQPASRPALGGLVGQLRASGAPRLAR